METPAGHTTFVNGTGHIKILVQLPSGTEIHLFQQVLYLPNFGRNLFSLTKVARQHYIFTICKAHTCELIRRNELIMIGGMWEGSYILDFTVLLPPAIISHATSYGNIPSSQEIQDLYTWY